MDKSIPYLPKKYWKWSKNDRFGFDRIGSNSYIINIKQTEVDMNYVEVKIGDLVQYTDEIDSAQFEGIGIITHKREHHGGWWAYFPKVDDYGAILTQPFHGYTWLKICSK